MHGSISLITMESELARLSDSDLVAHYSDVMEALAKRGIVRSNNHPIADIAERIVADYVKGTLAPPNERAIDVISADSKRLQVKALRLTQPSRSTLSAIRSLDFDQLVAVVFEKNMRLKGAYFVPVAIVKEFRRYSKTWKADSLSLTKKLKDHDAVEWVDAGKLTAGASD